MNDFAAHPEVMLSLKRLPIPDQFSRIFLMILILTLFGCLLLLIDQRVPGVIISDAVQMVGLVECLDLHFYFELIRSIF